MAEVYLCGVDVGGSGTKAVLVDDGGRILAEAVEPSHLIQPGPGRIEQDPEEMVGSALRTLATCLQTAGVPASRVAALAVDGQMAGICLIDRDGQAVAPYDSWLDTRCAPYIERMRLHAERVLALTGAPPTYSHGPKILWWMHEQPEVFARVARVVMPAAYVTGRLCGWRAEDAVIDPTYLHFSCLSDTRAGAWSEELCDLFGVPLDRLPRVVEPWAVVGHLTDEAAAQTGLLPGTPVVAGCGDQAAAMLGAGILRPGMVYDAAGTASVLAVCVDRFVPDLEHRTLLAARLVPAGLWYAIGYVNGGGLNLRWWRDLLRSAGGADHLEYAWLDAQAGRTPPGAEGLLFVPHLGGRVCPPQPDVRGAWLGLTWTHGVGHLWRALLEGIACEYGLYLAIVRALVPGIRFEEVRVVGGGARSALWNQLKADLLGIPYVELNHPEAAALGSAILAGFGVGIFTDLEEAVGRYTVPTRRYVPNPETADRYRALQEVYRQVVEDAGLWQRLSRLRWSG